MSAPQTRKRPAGTGREFDKTIRLMGQLYGNPAPVETLLARLQQVRKTGPASWRSDCPNGHQHAKGSLAITQADDGRVLMHCFACSDVHGILAAVGLELADLFVERIRDPSPEARKAANEAFKRNGWRAALSVLSREAVVVLAAAGMLRQGHTLTAEDDTRLSLAMQRIDDAKAALS